VRVRITYDKIERTFRKTVRCTYGCGRYVTRQKTFMQTQNPFNVHELTKLPKDHLQIVRELGEAGARWMLELETCPRCKTKEEATR
jgi:hypothetical protein